MTDEFMFSGNTYISNTGMLYEGSGDCGHWRCIAKVGESLFIFNDEHSPVQGSIQDLRLGTDSIFCKIDGGVTLTSNHTDTLDSRISSNYSCKVCGKYFLRPHFLRHHVLIDHRDKCCDECEEYFPTSQMVSDHWKKAHMEEDRTCAVCNRKFDSTEGVDAHMGAFHPTCLKDGAKAKVPEVFSIETESSLE